MNHGVALGYLVDRAAGEPPAAMHPVVWFGRYATWLEARTYRPTRRRGVAFVAASLFPVLALSLCARRLLGSVAAAALAGSIAIAARMLAEEATAVAEHLAGDEIDDARARAQGLVGRDLTDAPIDEIARAVVESVAENSVDASVATLWWGVVAGAPGVLAHRAVNTLDAMVGHRSERHVRFGWAAARLDDALNFVPARLAATTVAVVAPGRAPVIRRTVRSDGRAHP